ncbi:hypothetical protein [Demequina sp.]|uniref:hypothetical protein n=1 Tax=Demequina sp. TaxID=2050685 RepID=UPI003D0D0D68
MNDHSQSGAGLERFDINAQRDPFILRIESTSSTVYYLRATDERGLEVMRATGLGRSLTTEGDNSWHRVTKITSYGLDLSGEPDPMKATFKDDDAEPWVIRVGAVHVYEYRVPGGFADTTDYWWRQRPVTRLVLLGEMPPEVERAKTEGYVERPEGV